MAVSRFFGLPGCGKTTTLTWLAMSGVSSQNYDHVYGNVHLTVPGFTYVPFDVIGTYRLQHCLVLIDEAMVECGDREHKSFSKEKLQYFVEHRHYHCDIVLFSQEPDGVDKKIRSITDNMYYVRKGFFTGHWFSTIIKIPYGIVWPTENSNGENLGKIVMGYKKPPLFATVFAKRLYRPRYYPYFDSWEIEDDLKELPTKYQPNPVDPWRLPVFRNYSKMQRSFVKRRKKQIKRFEKSLQEVFK